MFHTVLKRAAMSMMKSKWISLSPLSRAMLVRTSSTSGTETDSNDTLPNNASSTPSPSDSSWSVNDIHEAVRDGRWTSFMYGNKRKYAKDV